MRRLVFATQQVDPAHPALAATVPKLAALARRLDELVVLADAAVPGVLPENCRVHTFGSRGKLGRGLRFEAALARELRPRPLAVVAHMAPIFAVLAAAPARAARVPVALWYTHWHASPTLRVAERLCNAILSVDRRSFPLQSNKVHAIGHGIDLTEFECAEHAANGTLRALALGRYSPAKGLDVVLRALRLAVDRGADVRLEAHGPVMSPLEHQHRAELERLVGELDLAERVELGEPVPRAEIPRLFARSDLLVNNMRAGAPDKVVYEAAASCLPVIASNPIFDAFLPPELRFERDDPGSLADRLVDFRPVPGRELRAKVERDHSVETWAERLLEVVEA
ncbi:MAG: glycosyltransferase family 4 protein [Actinomycetota bacterium]|nr:glycosyltransferase family 4 protein [Actinomycetota bacterium]